MKLILTLALSGSESRLVDRRYDSLTEMMMYYDRNYDDRRTWSYGCNCVSTGPGDRPLSSPGLGAPVDGLDKTCKTYKDCQACTRAQYGENCVAEFVNYRFKTTDDGITCLDGADTCKRAVCECAARFATEYQVEYAKNIWTSKEKSCPYHEFYGSWNMGSDCKPAELTFDEEHMGGGGGGNGVPNRATGGGGGENNGHPKCCIDKGKTTPFTLYHTESQICCKSSGRVVNVGSEVC